MDHKEEEAMVSKRKRDGKGRSNKIAMDSNLWEEEQKMLDFLLPC